MSFQSRTPATMRIRVPVRATLRSIAAAANVDSSESLTSLGEDPTALVLVALSGGADSLALAAAVAAEASAAGLRAGAVVVDHNLQAGSAGVASRAAEQARGLGLAPVLVRRVHVPGGLADRPASRDLLADPALSIDASSEVHVEPSGTHASGEVLGGDGRGSGAGGPEAAARSARYVALAESAKELGARAVLTAHTRDDQAEQVLLALARGSGTRSIAGIPLAREIGSGILVVRPLLDELAGVTREVTLASCAELGLDPWHDPHNLDRTFARVRVRVDALPLLEQQLGRGFTAALARSADLAREDADALDALAEQHYAAIVRHSNEGGVDHQTVMSVAALQELPSALRGRVIRLVADRGFGSHLTREHTLAIASLATAWKGQGPIHAPRIIARREGDNIVVTLRKAKGAGGH